MKSKFLLLAVTFILFNCKQETSQKQIEFDYKYPSVEKLVDCEGLNSGLFQEAMQSFENDIVKFYTPEKPIYSRAYSIFVGQAISNKTNYKKLVSEHSKTILEALKQDKSLWIENSNGTQLNYQHPIFKCIGDKLKDDPFRKTYNALIDTNSMSVRMFGGQLRGKTFAMKDDKYLATFVALELFYSQFSDVDFNSAVENNDQNTNDSHNSHDGHNH